MDQLSGIPPFQKSSDDHPFTTLIFKGLDALFLKGDKSLVESVVVLDCRFSSCDDMPGEFQDDIQKNFCKRIILYGHGFRGAA